MEIDLDLSKPDRSSQLVGVVDVGGKGESLMGKSNKTRVVGDLKLFPESKIFREVTMILKNVANLWDTDILKSLDSTKPLAKTPAGMYYDRWLHLRELGRPTVGSMRVVDENTVAMGDMTVGGGVFFGKEKMYELGGELEGKLYGESVRDNTQMEKVFLEIDRSLIEAEIDRVQDLAWKNGIKLPPDDPIDILVMPDGTFKVLVLDLSMLGLIDPLKDLANEKKKEREKITFLLDEVYRKLGWIKNGPTL